MELRKIAPGLLRAAHVRLAHDLHQRHAGPVDVHETVALSIRLGAVQQLGDVLFEVDAGDSYGPGGGANVYFKAAVAGYRLIVLRYLVALHQVGVRIVLAVELRHPGNGAARCEPGAYDQLDRLPVYNRQHPRHAHAHGAYERVGRGLLVGSGARAEHLAHGEQLRVYLQPYDDLILHEGKYMGREHLRQAARGALLLCAKATRRRRKAQWRQRPDRGTQSVHLLRRAASRPAHRPNCHRMCRRPHHAGTHPGRLPHHGRAVGGPLCI